MSASKPALVGACAFATVAVVVFIHTNCNSAQPILELMQRMSTNAEILVNVGMKFITYSSYLASTIQKGGTAIDGASNDAAVDAAADDILVDAVDVDATAGAYPATADGDADFAVDMDAKGVESNDHTTELLEQPSMEEEQEQRALGDTMSELDNQNINDHNEPSSEPQLELACPEPAVESITSTLLAGCTGGTEITKTELTEGAKNTIPEIQFALLLLSLFYSSGILLQNL
mmetsp:Transcript_14592/g.24177  ORF Transcript_14592/g.24177 Transcript_14592/m.24177 type:complete len:232 (-) Transcript_14592:107-802(-)